MCVCVCVRVRVRVRVCIQYASVERASPPVFVLVIVIIARAPGFHPMETLVNHQSLNSTFNQKKFIGPRLNNLEFKAKMFYN